MRHITALVAAGVLSGSTMLAAQSPATTTDSKSDSKEMTISGCVEKTKSGGYFLVPSSDKSPATTTGTSGATTTTATTTTDEKRMPGREATWNLGQSDKLERYVGQRVEVIGHAKSGTSGDQVKGTKGGELKARDFDVKSVAVLSPTCR